MKPAVELEGREHPGQRCRKQLIPKSLQFQNLLVSAKFAIYRIVIPGNTLYSHGRRPIGRDVRRSGISSGSGAGIGDGSSLAASLFVPGVSTAAAPDAPVAEPSGDPFGAPLTAGMAVAEAAAAAADAAAAAAILSLNVPRCAVEAVTTRREAEGARGGGGEPPTEEAVAPVWAAAAAEAPTPEVPPAPEPGFVSFAASTPLDCSENSS